jgi:uncharacterized membrane protein YphA (DoxX/SURF4 family)
MVTFLLLTNRVVPFVSVVKLPHDRQRTSSNYKHLKRKPSMNVTLWIIQIILALAFLVSGIAKAIRPSEKLRAGFPELQPGVIRLIAVAEILGTLGLILPGATRIAPVLTPVAATGLAIIMIGAVVTHARRHESKSVVVNGVLPALTVIVAVGRFGPLPL